MYTFLSNDANQLPIAVLFGSATSTDFVFAFQGNAAILLLQKNAKIIVRIRTIRTNYVIC